MTKEITHSYADTPITDVTELKFPRGLLNFKEDFRATSAQSGKEVILTNITSPLDRPENIRLASSDIANIYKGTSIEPSVSSPTKRGVSVLAQITNIISVTDPANSDFRIDLPLSAHLVLKVPASEYVNSKEVETLIGRLLSSLFDTGETDLSRLDAILRGSLLPKEV